MLATFNYHCPHCQHQLNHNDGADFLVNSNSDEKSKLQLSNEPGVYGYQSSHNLTIKNGDKIQFYCIKCESNLQSTHQPEFVGIELWTRGEKYLDLYFSPVCGQQETFVDLDGKLMRFGTDFFGVMEQRA